jgi:hypothetical protein
VKLTKRNAIAITCILVAVFVGLQVLRHRHDERPLSVFHQIGAVGYPEEISTGGAAIRVTPMDLPVRFRVGRVDSTIHSHCYSVELRWGERVRYRFYSSKPIDFMVVFSDEKWPDTGYLGSGAVVMANETSISSYEGEFMARSGGYLSFHFHRSWGPLDPPETSVVNFKGAYLWPFR